MSPWFSGPRLPLSPASPPDSGVKHEVIVQRPAVAPQTPPSPAHSGMSVATKRYVSSYENNRHTDEMADRSTPEVYSQSIHRSNSNPNSNANASTNTSQQPNMLKRPLSQDEDLRPTSKRQKKDAPEPEVELGNSFAATNHDRQVTRNGTISEGISDDVVAPKGSATPGNEQAVLEPSEKAFLVGSSSKTRTPHFPPVSFLN